MTKQTLLIAGAVVLFVAGGWYMSTQRTEAPSKTAENTPGPVTSTPGTTASTTQGATTTPTSAPRVAPPVVKSSPQPTATPKPSYATVIYDGQNFSPYKVTIAKGGVVRFVNLSNDPLWVASGIHPLHSEYPIRTSKDCAGSLFDECKAMARGEHWDFKFDVEGTWDYHNHKHPISEGVVRVLLPGER